MVARNRIVLLDLEETLIDDWSTRHILPSKLDKIRDSGILKPDPEAGVHQVRVGFMSWAIYDSRDAQIVVDELLELLQTNLDVKIDRMLPMTMDEYAVDLFSCSNLKLERQDLFDVFRKEEVLLGLARNADWMENKEVILIDDAVSHNLSYSIPHRFIPGKKTQVPRMTTVRFINIDQPVNTWQFTKSKE